ncbi:MAG: S-layer homology domain-containing protein [Paenibacillaceae bacterium]|nr:S-layer homology domain-containing protein [Paenibacillaceae bacterium]
MNMRLSFVIDMGCEIPEAASYPDGTFGPDRNITRAEAAAVFARISNDYQLVLPASGTESFTDVAGGHWAKEYIESVLKSGFMFGYEDGSFRPEASFTRGEAAVVVARFKQLKPAEGQLFSDTADHWANGAINALKNANMISGYPDGTFRPDQPIVRKEFVVMVNRMLQRGPIQNASVSTWSDVPVTNAYFKDIEEASTTHDYAVYSNGAELVKRGK